MAFLDKLPLLRLVRQRFPFVLPGLHEIRLSYLPPLMVYLAAGISGLTAIVGTFFVKEYLGLSAEFLAALGFWALLPWSMKMPIGHLVDLVWRYKGWLVVFSALLITASLFIMIGLLSGHQGMLHWMSMESWYVLSVLLAPTGYVIQDTVADAMTVEAIPLRDDAGQMLDEATLQRQHTRMQSLGRLAIIGGTTLVALVNVFMFHGVEALASAEKARLYLRLYEYALIIPLISVLGVVLAGWLAMRQRRRWAMLGIQNAVNDGDHVAPVMNLWVLLGGLAFLLYSIVMGLLDLPWSAEAVFAGSMVIILWIMHQLTRALRPAQRRELLATALVIFVFRAMPGPGAGSSWWMIDTLGFDQSFMARLSLLGSLLGMAGIFLFRHYMQSRSILQVYVMLTLTGTLLSLPNLGLYYGMHEWTAAHTGGLVDARVIALADTALESPLGQVAMIPMLSWIARSAPVTLKATYFAVMTAFTNMALSLAQLGTQYLNHVFVIRREVRDAVDGHITQAADYSQLGGLLWATILIGLCLPLLAATVAAWVLRRHGDARAEG